MTGYEVFKDVVIPLFAAVIGGSITLAGVYLTIKKADMIRKEDEIKKARPLFSFHIITEEPKLNAVMQHICFSDSNEKNVFAHVVFVELENSNLSSFEIKRIYHDDSWVGVEGNTVILPSAKCLLEYRFSESPTCIFLEIEDTLANIYYYHMSVLFLGCLASDGKNLHTVREIKRIEKKDMEKLMNISTK